MEKRINPQSGIHPFIKLFKGKKQEIFKWSWRNKNLGHNFLQCVHSLCVEFHFLNISCFFNLVLGTGNMNNTQRQWKGSEALPATRVILINLITSWSNTINEQKQKPFSLVWTRRCHKAAINSFSTKTNITGTSRGCLMGVGGRLMAFFFPADEGCFSEEKESIMAQ